MCGVKCPLHVAYKTMDNDRETLAPVFRVATVVKILCAPKEGYKRPPHNLG